MSRISIKDEKELAAPTRQASATLSIDTGRQGLFELTSAVEAWLERQHCRDGIVTLFIRHTSASLTIQENADPDVRSDLIDALDRLAPETAPWRHASEGPDDMPAHVKSALTGTSIAIPLRGGDMALGTWQGIYLVEHRHHVRSRTIQLHYLGS